MKEMILAGAVACLLFFGCIGAPAQNQTINQSGSSFNATPAPTQAVERTAKSGDQVEVDYTGRTNGTVFDTSIEKIAKESGIWNSMRKYEPLSFAIGGGQMIPGFEKAVIGMKEGETKTALLQPEEAYGERRNDLVVAIPLKDFEKMNATAKVGMTLTMTNGMRGVITEVTNESAVVDLNHALAGKTLEFEITLRKIK